MMTKRAFIYRGSCFCEQYTLKAAGLKLEMYFRTLKLPSVRKIKLQPLSWTDHKDLL